MSSHRVVFFGTPKIAASCLQALIDKKINVIGVVCRGDKPQGRDYKIVYSEVKNLAIKYHLPLFQPHKISEITQTLKDLQPDLIITCAYGGLVPESILTIPKYKCVNAHASLLPRWRGGAPIHYAIMHDDSQTGISLMYMDKTLDTGDIIYQQAISIAQNETYRSLYERLCELVYRVIYDRVDILFSVNLTVQRQDESKVTYAKNIRRLDELIQWQNADKVIDAKIRGLFDQPIAYAIYASLNIKILSAHLTNIPSTLMPGKITKISNEGIFVATKTNDLCLTKIQLPSKQPITIKEMINGHHIFKINGLFS